ncbi:MAG: DUF1365 family protein [Alphaproteobacteria bacterium]|nr:DUF1365 family protein [Alphaproteobacteria bacterium]
MTLRSAIYHGKVMHRRLRPKPHSLTYRVFSLLLDLDELPALSASSWVFGHNRRALVSFFDSDHGEGIKGGLRAFVEACLREAGRHEEGMRIEVLCYPRILGYVFNPLTVYFCYAPDGQLRTILYEVSNTYAERHTYVIPVDEARAPIRQSCDKMFYVSPFMPMACRYHFVIAPPGERLRVRIDETDTDGPLLVATFSGERAPLTDLGLLHTFLAHPLMTMKVTMGIYWEALRLWGKGVPVHARAKPISKIARTIAVSSKS